MTCWEKMLRLKHVRQWRSVVQKVPSEFFYNFSAKFWADNLFLVINRILALFVCSPSPEDKQGQIYVTKWVHDLYSYFIKKLRHVPPGRFATDIRWLETLDILCHYRKLRHIANTILHIYHFVLFLQCCARRGSPLMDLPFVVCNNSIYYIENWKKKQLFESIINVYFVLLYHSIDVCVDSFSHGSARNCRHFVLKKFGSP